MGNDNQKRSLIDTVRLSARDRRKVLDTLARGTTQVAKATNRRGLRVDFPVANVFIAISGPNGDATKYAVMPRNLARRGMAFVHGRFIHTDAACGIILPTLRGEWVQLQGKILRCRHVDGLIHEVSVVFDEAVDLNWFVELSEEDARRHELEQQSDEANNITEASPGTLPSKPIEGKALLVCSNEAVRHATALSLRRLGLSVIDIARASEARSLCEADYPDISILDISSEGVGIGGLSTLRDVLGGGKPSIIFASDNDDGQRAAATAEGANAFMVKPVDLLVLRQTVAQLLNDLRKPKDRRMIADSGEVIDKPQEGGDAIYSTRADDPDIGPMLDQFVPQLHDYAKTLKAGCDRKELASIKRVCSLLAGAATNYGFGAVAYVAKTTAEAIEERPGDWDAVAEATQQLVDVLLRVKVK